MCTNESEKKKALLILEDDKGVLDACESQISNYLKDVYVKGCQTIEEANRAMDKMDEQNYRISVFIVDQVKGSGQGGNRQWGIDFLKKIKTRYPDSFRIMFTNQAERNDIQDMLNQGLIHDFADKDNIDENLVLEKIKDMVIGINSGNIQDPSSGDAEKDFKEFLQKWINSMPKQKDTIIDGLNGESYKAGELLSNPELRKSFRRIFDAMKLDRLADRYEDK